MHAVLLIPVNLSSQDRNTSVGHTFEEEGSPATRKREQRAASVTGKRASWSGGWERAVEDVLLCVAPYSTANPAAPAVPTSPWPAGMPTQALQSVHYLPASFLSVLATHSP